MAGAAPAAADGGVLQVAGEPAGPYAVTVYTDPIRVGTIDVSVLVERGRSGQVEPNARVAIVAAREGGGGQAFAATHEQATRPPFYAANVPLTAPGRWRLTVQVSGPLGDGSVAFAVRAAGTSSGRRWTWTLLAEGIAVTLIALWGGSLLYRALGRPRRRGR